MIIRAIDRKLLRDLSHTKGQALAISLVISCGVAMFIMSLSTLESLRITRQRYYDNYAFAHVFARLKRAPESLRERIAEIPDVASVTTRVVQDVTLDIPSLPEPAVGRLISLPPRRNEGLNRIFLREGRYVERNRGGEVLVGESFAKAHDLHPGDSVLAIMNGRKQSLKIVGVALSPEYILQIREGELLPDEKRFGIFWMDQEELAAVFDMDGAFNDVTMRLLRGASEQEVLDRLDDLIEPYGGVGSYGRDQQLSHRYLSDEMSQLRTMGMIAPMIFLSVAAFLLNVVMSRQIRVQREQIAALKAFGYNKYEVGWHYLKLVLLISAIGMVLGVVFGVQLGRNLTVMYTRFYKFPVFQFFLDWRIVISSVFVSGMAAALGTFASVRSAIRLPPAEAMRPEPPANYRPTLAERSGLGFLLSPAGRMIMRNLERQPLKSFLSCLGIAMAVSVLILGAFMEDSLDYIIHFQFFLSQRYDMNVALIEPSSPETIHEIRHLPGVVHCEPYRAVATKMRFGPIERRVGIMGLAEDSDLFRLINEREAPVAMPPDGLMLSSKLAELLGAKLNDRITVEVQEGDREVRLVPVTALVTEFGGTNAYMSAPALHRLLQETDTISGAFLTIDQNRSEPLYRKLKNTPRVASVSVKDAALQSFHDTIAENLSSMRAFNIMFACVIAFGVVYNNARISVAERSRELATLRVIGFTRSEISRILLGEMAIITALAIPLGMLMGYGFGWYMTQGLDTEVYRIPLVINPTTYAFAACVVILATIISSIGVRRQLYNLDLVAVLKTKE
ncbi:MAG: FtsX-like permease family protein [Planctomycetales bacterium]|nr:FtsX-like permease family protein [Planctomycetales bacterium]